MVNNVDNASSSAAAQAASAVDQNKPKKNPDLDLINSYFRGNESLDNAKFNNIRDQLQVQIKNNPDIVTKYPSRLIITFGNKTYHVYNFENEAQHKEFNSGKQLEFYTSHGKEYIDNDTKGSSGSGLPVMTFYNLFDESFCKRVFDWRKDTLSPEEQTRFRDNKFNVHEKDLGDLFIKMLNNGDDKNNDKEVKNNNKDAKDIDKDVKGNKETSVAVVEDSKIPVQGRSYAALHLSPSVQPPPDPPATTTTTPPKAS